MNTFVPILILSLTSRLGGATESALHNQHVGCFKDNESDRDLQFAAELQGDHVTIEKCILECAKNYYMFAGLQKGQYCFCGSSYGRYGSGNCQTQCSGDEAQICGGDLSNTIYNTNLQIPGPPSNLQLNETKESSLTVSWDSPNVPTEFITEFHIYAQLNKSFDLVNSFYAAKHIQLSNSSRSTTIIGLMAGSLYNVSVAAASKNGIGPILTEMFWTEIGTPTPPDPPVFVHHESDDHSGLIHVKLTPSEQNRKGPITAYRVVVIDETDPAPFHEDSLGNWTVAEEEGLNYWIAAELTPDWFKTNEVFVVGDGQTYGDYLNHGPLTEGRDYHVTVGLVSTMNNVTKVSYARVTHEQHATENIVVFEFHSNGEPDDHDHDHHSSQRRTKYSLDASDKTTTTTTKSKSSDVLAISLSVAVIVAGLIFAAVLIFYVYLRRCSHRRPTGSRGDVQELTTHSHMNGDIEGMGNGFTVEDTASVLTLDAIRPRAWSIPRNFLELSHEVVGRGRFGSLVKGIVNKRGRQESCNVQVVPGKILEEEEMQAMTQSLDLLIRSGSHPNIIQLIGLCEDKETIFVVLEEGTLTLKQVLLDSRCLIHHPSVAEQTRKFSSLKEETAFDFLIGIANGMAHLVEQGIFHRKLCARNIFIGNFGGPGCVAKIGGIGIADYSKPGQECDVTRWTAAEAFHSKNYVAKCDVWSFGILMWEIFSLGGTPYPEVKTREVSARVSRGGLRVPQTPYMSDELYQLMLQCWQMDLDERPDFDQLSYLIADLAQNGNMHVNFSTYPEFQYEEFVYSLECQ